ncbi:MAG: redoxin domain-containing protein [Planctomycetota bacterium]
MKLRWTSGLAIAVALVALATFGFSDRVALAGDEYAEGASCTDCSCDAKAEPTAEVAFNEAPTAGLPVAPDFTLTSSAGNAHSLGDFAGKHVVLEWFNPDCPFVKKFYTSGKMQELQQAYADQGVVWLAIQSTNPEHGNYYDAAGMTAKAADWGINATAILMDDDGAVGQAYGATTTPHMYIINPDGKLIYQGAIDSDSSASPDAIPSATNYVQVVLDAALLQSTDQYGCSVKYAQ